MADTVLLALATVAATFGMAWFALAKEAHWMQIGSLMPLTEPMKHTLHGFGTTALVASLFLCLVADHPTMAALVWIMLLAVGALAAAFTLAWRASWLAFLVSWLQSKETQPK